MDFFVVLRREDIRDSITSSGFSDRIVVDFRISGTISARNRSQPLLCFFRHGFARRVVPVMGSLGASGSLMMPTVLVMPFIPGLIVVTGNDWASSLLIIFFRIFRSSFSLVFLPFPASPGATISPQSSSNYFLTKRSGPSTISNVISILFVAIFPSPCMSHVLMRTPHLLAGV